MSLSKAGVFSDMKAVPVEQGKAAPHESRNHLRVRLGGAAGGEALGVEVTVGDAVLGPAVVDVVDDVGAVDDEEVGEADATVVAATVATTMSALEKARTIGPRFRRRLDGAVRPMATMRRCP